MRGQSTFQCPHGVRWEETCAICEEDACAEQTPQEALQEIFDILKDIPLNQLTEYERRILMVTQFHGCKV